MQARILDTFATDSDIHTLIALGEDWDDWTYQIERKVFDGKAYGKPGEAVCTGWQNFTDAAKARERFAAIATQKEST